MIQFYVEGYLCATYNSTPWKNLKSHFITLPFSKFLIKDCVTVVVNHYKMKWQILLSFLLVIAWFKYCECEDSHEDFNNYEQFFDAGDCCLPNPTVFYEGEKVNSAYGFSNPWFSNPPRPCLENECICIPNNLVCNATQLGDGKCQDYNNGPLCDYDLGDCCLRWMPDFDIDECCNCLCHLGYDHFLTNNIPTNVIH